MTLLSQEPSVFVNFKPIIYRTATKTHSVHLWHPHTEAVPWDSVPLG